MAATLITPVDPTAALAQRREARYLKREARILASNIDPRLKAMYLSRTLLGTQEVVDRTGLSRSRLSVMRAETRAAEEAAAAAGDTDFDDSHPGRFPGVDEVLRIHNRIKDPGVEEGRLDEWLVWSGRQVFNHRTGRLQMSPQHPGHLHGRRAEEN